MPKCDPKDHKKDTCLKYEWWSKKAKHSTSAGSVYIELFHFFATMYPPDHKWPKNMAIFMLQKKNLCYKKIFKLKKKFFLIL